MHMQSVAKYVQSQSKLDTHTLARGLWNTETCPVQ
jgi:hypothetical protein